MEAVHLSPKSRSTFRATMREATAPAHARLDGLFEAMLATDDRDLYRRFLAMNHACLRTIDPFLARSPLQALVPEIGAPARMEALNLDIADLGVRPVVLPPVELDGESLPTGFAVAYVVEGSRLGSSVLHRRLLKARERTPDLDLPGRYLAESAGARTFAILMTHAERFVWSEETLEEAALAARRTFDVFLLAALRTEQHA